MRQIVTNKPASKARHTPVEVVERVSKISRALSNIYTSKGLFAQTRQCVMYGIAKPVRLVSDARQFRNSPKLPQVFYVCSETTPEAIAIAEGIAHEFVTVHCQVAGQHRQPIASSLCSYVTSDVTPLLLFDCAGVSCTVICTVTSAPRFLNCSDLYRLRQARSMPREVRHILCKPEVPTRSLMRDSNSVCPTAQCA